MKKVSKIMKIAIVLLAMTMIVSNFVFASDYASLITDLDGQAGYTGLNESAKSIVGAIISVTKIVAVGVALIMLAAVAMKYMSSAPGDRAEIKKQVFRKNSESYKDQKNQNNGVISFSQRE